MERKIDIEVSLNGLQVQEKPLFCQGDKNTHFLEIRFMNDMDLSGYTLQVYYLPPYPCVVPYADLFSEVTSNPFKVPIPDKCLERNGLVKVEFSLSKEPELITINKRFDFEVIKTINGTGLTAIPEGTLKETIAQQIEKIKDLLADTDTKIAEYNNNATEKTNEFNSNSEEKLSTYNENDKLKKEAYDNNATEKLEAYNNNDTSKTTAFNENAKKKTTEFDAHIKQTTDSTYLEMDKKATEYANLAGEKANLKVKEQENLSVQAITNEGTRQIGFVENKGTEEIGKIQTAGVQAVGDVNANKDAHIKAVTDEGNKQVLAVGNKGAEEVAKVQTAGEKAVEDVNANKATNIQNITGEGTTQVGLIKTEGEKQVGLIGDKGIEQTKLVTDEGIKQITEVSNKGTEEIGKVTKEGTTQVGAVQNQGSLSLDKLLKIQKEIEAILKNQEAIGNALSLNGKTGPEYDKETRNITGGEFDTALLYLNDAGTKTAGKLYYDKNKSGVFKCIQTTTATVNSTTNFVDISNLENANKLENLITIKKYNSDEIFYCDEKEEIISGLPCLEIKFNNIIIITGRVGGCSSYILKDHIKNSMNILSMLSNSDTPDSKTAEPVSVIYNRGKFVLPHSRMIHFTLIAKL